MTQKPNSASPDRPVTPPNQTGTFPQTPSTRRSHFAIGPSIVQARLNAYDSCASYAAAQNLIRRVEFQSGKGADVLVAKGCGDSEFILRGVFQIARNEFYFTPDANFDPANAYSSRFQDVKQSCRLTTPTSPDFAFAQTDFNKCVENIRSFEKLIEQDTNCEVRSVLSEHLGKMQFKLSHALFEPKSIPTPEQNDDNQDTDDDQNESQTIKSDTEDDPQEIPSPDFAMESWPVSTRCQPHLKELFDTHDICPLPAYDSQDKLIPPMLYEQMLPGATVEIHFAFVHHHIKKAKRHVYMAMLRNLVILRPPDRLPKSPFKRPRVSARGSTGKGKNRA